MNLEDEEGLGTNKGTRQRSLGIPSSITWWFVDIRCLSVPEPTWSGASTLTIPCVQKTRIQSTKRHQMTFAYSIVIII